MFAIIGLVVLMVVDVIGNIVILCVMLNYGGENGKRADAAQVRAV